MDPVQASCYSISTLSQVFERRLEVVQATFYPSARASKPSFHTAAPCNYSITIEAYQYTPFSVLAITKILTLTTTLLLHGIFAIPFPNGSTLRRQTSVQQAVDVKLYSSISCGETKGEFPKGDLVASGTRTCTRFNGGSTANRMRVHNIADNRELILFNDDTSNVDPQPWLGIYAHAQGTPGTRLLIPDHQKSVGALPIVEAYTMACR